ncbi:F5/8 type C domain-containing protein [Candidatus Nitrososphaera evergladensis SR1]|uniref:F5/8 type C domain-containing protein n=1 Tax=Candidatus Nitrososphaera evergladensis SR1 TaxID=1459636 RepID=A0A075MXU2_9ARCH|nr:discoidin domain-containing protein [Candidatus Nitrososphaera evergladensis]AIF85432.1 F5/8 type C domain-containing protein [Candidatus Nitrososphaera evergladensis SR1]
MWGGLSEQQIADIVEKQVGVNKVKMPSPVVGDYQSPVLAVATSDTIATTPVTWSATSTSSHSLRSGSYTRAGMRITDATKRGLYLLSATFYMGKALNPTGNVVATLRKTSDDSIIASSTPIDATTINSNENPVTFTFNRALTPNEDFRISVEYSGGDASNFLSVFGNFGSSQYSGGMWSLYAGSWGDDGIGRDLRGSMTLSAEAYVLDGNTATAWNSNSQTNPFIYLDMGSSKLISGVRIYWPTSNRPTNYVIETSIDTLTWTPVLTLNSQPAANAWTEYAFNTVVARYFRVRDLDAGSVVMSIAEIQYYVKTTDQVLSTHGHGDV